MINLVIKYRSLLLILIIGSTVFALVKMQSLYFNTDFSQFLSENDPEYTFYNQIKSEIQDDENILVIGVEDTNTVFNFDFLNQVQIFTDSLKTIPNLKKVRGLADLSYPVNTLFGLIKLKYLNIKDSTKFKSYQKKIFEDTEWTQHFINKKGTILFIWIELEKGLSNQQTEMFLDELMTIRRSFTTLNTFLIGKKYLESSFKKILSKEITRFIFWFFLFLIIALLLIFRKPIGIIFPLVLVFISLIIFLGGMALLNRPLGIMSNLFPVIILIVGISDVIHMAFKYNMEKRQGEKAERAILITLKEIGWTTFITSFTTAIGFFVLYLSPMQAMRDFGLEAGVAVLLAYVLTFLLVPTFFSGPKKKSLFSLNKYFEKFSKILITKVEFLQNYPKGVISFYILLFVVAFFGVLSINTNNLRLSNVPSKSDLSKNYIFFEKNTGGSRNFELILLAKNKHKLDEPDILKSSLNIHQYLDSLPYLSAVKSPILYYKALNKAYRFNRKENIPIPQDEKIILKYKKQFKIFNAGNYLFNEQHTVYKFSCRMKDLGRNVVSEKNKEIIQKVNTLIDASQVEARISGMDFLIDRAHKERINNMLYGLLIAVIIVAIILGIIYKNIALIILTLLLNFIPIFISAGIMGFTNLELRGATSIIFTIGFVIAVDDTIHLLSKFQWERTRGKNVEQAISLALHECGKAILATSIILIGGFAILMYSDFMEIYTLGLLVSIIVLITLSVDFVLAPILVLTWFKKYI